MISYTVTKIEKQIRILELVAPHQCSILIDSLNAATSNRYEVVICQLMVIKSALNNRANSNFSQITQTLKTI